MWVHTCNCSTGEVETGSGVVMLCHIVRPTWAQQKQVGELFWFLQRKIRQKTKHLENTRGSFSKWLPQSVSAYLRVKVFSKPRGCQVLGCIAKIPALLNLRRRMEVSGRLQYNTVLKLMQNKAGHGGAPYNPKHWIRSSRLVILSLRSAWVMRPFLKDEEKEKPQQGMRHTH